MRPIVYIAGPISNPDAGKLFENLHRFFLKEVQLWKAGFSPINPASDIIAAIMCGDLTHADYLAKDQSLVAVAEYIFMLPGWTDSPGAREEYSWAGLYDTTPVHSMLELNEAVEEDGRDWIDNLPTGPDE